MILCQNVRFSAGTSVGMWYIPISCRIFGNSNRLILAIMFYHLRAQEWEFGVFRSLVEMMVSLIDECVCQNVGSLAGKREDLVYIPISYCQ